MNKMTDAVQADNVTNINTIDWSPEQVSRWLQQKVDAGEVKRVIVAIELSEDGEDGQVFQRMWSKSSCQALLYISTWLHRNTVERYFG